LPNHDIKFIELYYMRTNILFLFLWLILFKKSHYYDI